ncbi:hypothetical protein NN561_006031 [Cricetulus griseus]
MTQPPSAPRRGSAPRTRSPEDLGRRHHTRTSLNPPRASAPGPLARHVRGLSRRPRRPQQEARGPLEVAPPRGCPRATHSPGLGAARMGRRGMHARTPRCFTSAALALLRATHHFSKCGS